MATAPSMVLKLYITGATARSLRAIENIKAVCNEHLEGQYQLEVIDLYEHPDQAALQQIIAAPTLVKTEPPPERRFIGDLSDTAKVRRGLNIPDKN